jgi:hypothetical protein
MWKEAPIPPRGFAVDQSCLSPGGFIHGDSMIHFRNIYWDLNHTSGTSNGPSGIQPGHSRSGPTYGWEMPPKKAAREVEADLDVGPIGHSGLNDV